MRTYVEKSQATLQAVETMIAALSPAQRERLSTMLQLTLKFWDGKTGIEEPAQYVMTLPKSDLSPIAEILRTMGRENK